MFLELDPDLHLKNSRIQLHIKKTRVAGAAAALFWLETEPFFWSGSYSTPTLLQIFYGALRMTLSMTMTMTNYDDYDYYDYDDQNSDGPHPLSRPPACSQINF